MPESYDNTVTKLLLESGKLNPASIATMLLRKCDWHDEKPASSSSSTTAPTPTP